VAATARRIISLYFGEFLILQEFDFVITDNTVAFKVDIERVATQYQ
jgi:hypothetical protein